MMDNIPTTVHIEPKEKVPKLSINNYFGKDSFVTLDGVVFGEGVKSVEYRHVAGEPPMLKLVFNVDAAELMAIEGNEPVPVVQPTETGE